MKSGKQTRPWAVGFPPLDSRCARVLILGSLPGAESIRQGEYYAHPRNVFWPLMGELCGAGRELDYAARLWKLAARGIALWDVLHAAQRPGSLDAAIHPRRLAANDIPALLARHPDLDLIAFNGGAAETLFNRHVRSRCGAGLVRVRCRRLPSTSPACARWSYARKLAAWQRALGPTLDRARRDTGRGRS